MVSVAGGRPGGDSVDLAVGDGDTVGRSGTEDDVLATDEVGGYVIDPDEIS